MINTMGIPANLRNFNSHCLHLHTNTHSRLLSKQLFNPALPCFAFGIGERHHYFRHPVTHPLTALAT